MKKLFLLGLFCVLSQVIFCQSKIDSALYKQLSVMFKNDQKWRLEYIKLNKHEHSDYDNETIQKNWAIADSLNLIEAKSIIKQYGYPGYTKAGEGGSGWFWSIVQHCDDDVKFQEQVLALMDKEVKKHNASGEDYAYLKDRVLVNLSQKQLFGTQLRYNPQTHKSTPFPIQDSLKVDERRKQVGLSTLKEYISLNDSMH